MDMELDSLIYHEHEKEGYNYDDDLLLGQYQTDSYYVFEEEEEFMETATFSAGGGGGGDIPKSAGPIQISFGEKVQAQVVGNSSGSSSATFPTNSNRIISERRRRQKLGQSIISLSALIPGLKKMDKASILGGAIQYLKQLEESVKSLEEKLITDPISEGGDPIMTTNIRDQKEYGLEINAIISGKSILINVYYELAEKIKGFETMLLTEIAKFRLSIVNASFLPFGLSHVEATIVTQMEADFNMSIEDLGTTLQSAIISSVMARSRGYS